MSPNSSPAFTSHPRPEMSAQEASWHEHHAGMRAADNARAQGADPAATAAFAAATAGPVTIAGRRLHEASQGTIWTLQRVARIFAQWADDAGLPASPDPDQPGTRELIELGLATLVFCDSRAVWQALDAGGGIELFQQAENMMWDMPLAEQLALQTHFRAGMDRVRALAGNDADPAEKKTPPPPAAGLSSAMPTLPRETASPPSNGSPRSIESPFPMRFGEPPLP